MVDAAARARRRWPTPRPAGRRRCAFRPQPRRRRQDWPTARRRTAPPTADCGRRRRPDSCARHDASLPRRMEAAGLGPRTAAPRQAPAEVNGDGALFPALVIGLGQVGLTVLQRLRENLHERFGSLAQLAAPAPAAARHRPGGGAGGHARPARRGTVGQRGAAGPAEPAQPLPQAARRQARPRDLAQPAHALPHPALAGDDRRARPGPAGLLRQLPRPSSAASQAELDGHPRPGRAARRPPSKRGWACAPTGRASTSSPAWPAAPAAACSSTWPTPSAPCCGRWATSSRTWSACCCCRPWTAAATRAAALGNAYAALTELSHFASPQTRVHGPLPRARGADRGRRAAVQPLHRPAAAAGRGRRGGHAARWSTWPASSCTATSLAAGPGRRPGPGRPAAPAVAVARPVLPDVRPVHPRLAAPPCCARRPAACASCLVQRWMSKDSKPMREAVQAWVQEQWAA